MKQETKMFKSVYFLLFLLFSIPVVSAQSRAEEGMKRMQEIKEKLNLTEPQVNKIQKLFLDIRQENEKIDVLSSVTPEEKRKMKTRVKWMVDDSIQVLLSPEQYEKYLDYVLGIMVDKELVVIEIKVGLTGTQTATIRSLMITGLKDMKKLREEGFSRQKIMSRVGGILKDIDLKVEEMLDSKQLPKYRSYKEERKRERRGIWKQGFSQGQY